MERLTAKHIVEAMKDEKNLTASQKKELKLGQLEDIEEELGIDLITLYKALKEGFYYKDEFGDIEHVSKEMLSMLGLHSKLKELKNDYGRIALTKEELEK